MSKVTLEWIALRNQAAADAKVLGYIPDDYLWPTDEEFLQAAALVRAAADVVEASRTLVADMAKIMKTYGISTFPVTNNSALLPLVESLARYDAIQGE